MLSRRVVFFALRRSGTSVPIPSPSPKVASIPFLAYHKSAILFQEDALKANLVASKNDLEWSMDKLNKTSRSFSAVIVQLPEELRHAVSMFYLTLRALDTIEDDMSVDVQKKRAELLQFVTHLREANWNLTGYGDSGDSSELLQNFHKVINCIQGLTPAYYEIIREICSEMAHGMSGFLDSPVKSIQDWDKYCYYAAGVVGIGLSKMWVASGLESNKFLSEDFKLKSKEMGLLLQKTNIIRDCREDILQNRAFLPQEIWGKYLNNYSELFQLKHKEAALHSLNEYVTDALKHTPSCLDYLSEITSPSIFRFCAIPQVMAIATLALCYNNYSVFLESVKIPRFESIQIMTGSSNYPNVLKYFSHYAERVTAKIPTADPISVTIAQRLEEIIKRNEKVQYSQH